MNVQDIINATADDADDFLSGMTSMTEARPAIRAYLSENYPNLSPAESARVIAGLLAVLDEEGFFEAGGDGEAFAKDEADSSEDE